MKRTTDIEIIKSAVLSQVLLRPISRSNVMVLMIDIIDIIQKTASKTIKGVQKKQIAIDIIKDVINICDIGESTRLFLDNYVEEFIDTVIAICRNKKLIKHFKKNCKCF